MKIRHKTLWNRSIMINIRSIMILKLIILLTCVLDKTNSIESTGQKFVRHKSDFASVDSLNEHQNKPLDRFVHLSRVVHSSKSKPFTGLQRSKLSANLLKRIKRENQLLLNNDLANGHDSSNTFQPANVWTQDLNNAQLADGERHLSSDIELPEYSEEDDDIEDEETKTVDKEEKDPDYEDDDEIPENEKNYKKNKKNRNRGSKKKDKNNRIESGSTNNENTSQPGSTSNNGTLIANSTITNDSAQTRKTTKDYTTNYIELISGPGNLTKKAGEKVILRCSFEAKPRPKIKWLKNEGPLDKLLLRNKYQIKEKRLSQNKLSTRLIISQLDTHDIGFYQCRAQNNQGIKVEGVGILKIRSNDIEDNRNGYNGLNSNSVIDHHTGTGLDLIGVGGSSGDSLNLENTILPSGDSTFHMTQDAGSDIDRIPFFQDYPRFSESNILDTDHTQPLHNSLDALTQTNSHTAQCVSYKGTVCSQYLRNHTVVIQRQSQYQLEELLGRAFRIIANAANISPQCHRFTMPLLCFQSFHACEQAEHSPLTPDHSISSSLTGNIINRMQQMQADHTHPFSTNSAAYSSHYASITSKQSSFSHKQLCRDECEILEHDICSLEFALSKINQVAGLKSLLPNCIALPRVGTIQHENCLRIGVTQDFYTPLTNHKCYLDKGETYRGNVNITISGKPCEIWSAISPANSNHPELSGSHNFCRNPKGVLNGPWCHVKNENQQYYKELCNVPRCDDHFWIYYLLTPLLAIFTLSLLIGSICCARNCSQQRKPIAEGICLSANEIFAQQIHQQHLLQSNMNSLGNNSSSIAMALPFAFDRQSTMDHNQPQNSISTASSKQSHQSLLSNVLNTVAHPSRALSNAIGQSTKNGTNASSKIDQNSQNNLELKALLSNNESSATATTSSHYALSSLFRVNITGNPISNNLVHYPLHCIRILSRVYPRLTSHHIQQDNSYSSSSNEDATDSQLKSSLNYQFYIGQLNTSNQSNSTQPVVIRALKLTSDPQNITLFAEQSSQLSALSHENVIKIIGVAIGSNNHSLMPQHFVIFEQFSPVSLLHFLQQQPLPNQANSNSVSTFNQNIQTTTNSNGTNCLVEYIDLLQIAYQIANGMAYLSRNGYVHGDLACRNCYINYSSPSADDNLNIHSRFRLKIGGLRLQSLYVQSNSRWVTNGENKKTFKNSKDLLIQELKEKIVEEQIDDQDYYTLNVQRKAFPVRWLPPEFLLSFEYSTATDVWSYGVTLFEIMSFCRQVPFQTYTNSQVVDFIIAGRLLDRPSYCEPSFYALMLDCWREVPSQRSNFSELSLKLAQLINTCSSNNLQSSSSHNNWSKTNSNRNNRVSSPMPSHRTNAIKQPFGEDKVNGWLLDSSNANEFTGSTYNSKNSNSALKSNTMNSSSTYASSYCNNPANSPNYNLVNSSTTTSNNQQVDDYDYSYDQPFVQINDLEASQKLLKPLKQPTLSTFQSKPRNGHTAGLKHFDLKNHHLVTNYTSKFETNSNDDYYENHYSKLTYENEETDSVESSNFRLI